MVRKATGTQDRRSGRALPPLDDMRWRPADEIIERLFPHIGSKILIAHDLTEALASEKVHCMRRRIVIGGHPLTGHRELVRASFWAEHRFTYWPNGTIRVEVRPPQNHRGPWAFTWIANWLFYLWQPHCVKVWPTLAPREADESEAEASEPTMVRRRPGPKPKKDWKLFVAAKLWEARKTGKRVPTAANLAQDCEDELGYQPDTSHLQRWLRQLLD
jgi:hypothetical protein